MINFELDGTQYRIRFKHYTREQLLQLENQEHMPNLHKPSNGATYAILQKRVGGEWQVQTFQAAFCMFLDTFNRARGREIALKRLLECADVFKNQDERKDVYYVHSGRNRDLRLKIWRLYFDKVRAAEAQKFLSAQLKQSQKDALTTVDDAQ